MKQNIRAQLVAHAVGAVDTTLPPLFADNLWNKFIKIYCK